MNRMTVRLASICLLLLTLAGCGPVPQAATQSASTVEWLAETDPGMDSFTRADQARAFVFPADHGAHDDFQTEWWYFTGNLTAENGRRFGFELTFFRRALTARPTDRSSAWATSQIYMAHFAVTDAQGRQFHNSQKFSRSGLDLAGAAVDPLARIWLEDWEAAQVSDTGWQLNAQETDYSLSLGLQDLTGPVLQGEKGLSRKSAENASYYYSLPNLAAGGTITIGTDTYKVTGSAWMDHEFSTSALAADQVGWDWFALQLKDGRQLMLFTLRRVDGSIDPFSSGTLIQTDGSTVPLLGEDFSIEITDHWTSPRTKANYPAGWQIRIPAYGVEVQVRPVLPDQELNLAFTYWEGAVDVTGGSGGWGYVELTGYSASMQGVF